MRLVIDDTQLARLAEAWEQSADVVREHLLDAMTEADLLLEREVKEGTPVGIGGGGGLRGSVFSEEEAGPTSVQGIVGSAAAHAIPVELGTEPHHPPVQPIADWVRQKLGILDRDAAESAAWAIAKKIAKKGTEGAFMFRDALSAQERAIQRIFAERVDRLLTEVLP